METRIRRPATGTGKQPEIHKALKSIEVTTLLGGHRRERHPQHIQTKILCKKRLVKRGFDPHAIDREAGTNDGHVAGNKRV